MTRRLDPNQPDDYLQPLVTPSVLDRLLDDAPREQEESSFRRSFDLRALKRSVARDMEALLNARRVESVLDLEDCPNALRSMIDFGITDLSSLSLLDPDDRTYLRDKIRIAIERHEPRLSKVVVNLDAPAGTERMLRFRVDAQLEVVPTRPPVSFDATLQISTNSYQIRDA